MPTFSNLTNGSSTTSFVTASVSPTVGRLILVTVHAYIATGSLPPSTPTVTGNGITYTLEETVTVDGTGADQSVSWVFRGKLPSTSAGAITFSFSPVVPTRCSWIVDQGSSDIDSSGANAANAIVAATKNKLTSATTVTTNPVNFVGSMTSGNGAYYTCAIENNNSQAPEGTWTQTANQIGTSLIGVSAQYLTTGTDTGTATTWTTAARSGAILLEILAGAVVPPGDTSESKLWTPGFMSTAGFPEFLVSLAAPFQRAIMPFAGSPVASLPGVVPGVEPEAHAHNPVLKDANDNLYRLMESDLVNPPAAGNHPLMYKSSDGGITWTDMDSVNRPGAVDLEATWVLLVGTQIIVTINRDDTVWFVPFNTSDSGTPDTWGTQETVDTGLSSTGVEQYVSHVRTSDGQYWIFYSDALATTNQQVAYRRRTAVNTYSAKTDLGGNTAVSYTGPAAVLGAGDVAHVFYTDVTNAHLYYRALTTGGTLSGATQVDSAGTSGFSGSPSRYVNTNPVYYDDAGTEVVSVLYADTSNMLKLVRVVGGTPQTPEAVSTSSVLNNPSATTSDAIIAHLAVDGTTTIAVWSDAATGDLLWRRRDAAGTWDAISTLWASGGNAAYYVFPLVFTRAGRRVMGYAYDVGDHPNDVSNLRYSEADLGAAGASGTAEAGVASTGATTQATQVKVAKLSGVCSVAAVPTGRSVKVAPTKTTAPAAAIVTGQAVKVATETATTTAAATATVVRANSKAQTGTASTAATTTGRAAKVAVQRGVCSAASSLQGAGRKVTVQAGAVTAAAAGTSRAVKVAPAAAQVGTAGTVQAVPVKRTPAAAQVQAAASAAATCRKLAVAGGRTYAAGFSYWSQVVAPRAVYGICSAGGLATGRAAHVATRSGQVAGGAFTRSAVMKRAASGGTSSTTGVCQAGGRKRSIVGGSSGAAALLTGAVGKRVGQAGASYVLVLVVGQRRALVSYTPRPDSGTTARPNSGTTVRPNSGITPRPATFT